jgi:LysM repeat protein
LAEAQQSTQCPDCGARYDAEQHACPICGACFEQLRGFDWSRLGLVVAGLAILIVLSGYVWRSRAWERTEIALAPTGTPTLTPYPTWTPSLTPPPTMTPTASPAIVATPTPAASPSAQPTATEAATPTEEPTIEPTAAPTQVVDRYAVQSGDNPGSIARRFGMTLEALLSANNLTERSILQVGQELVITGANPPASTATPMPTPTATVLPTSSATEAPATGGGPTLAAETLATPSPQTLATPAPLVHVVGPGDILGSLAVRYDVSAEEIATANNITLRTILRVGQELTIPGKQTTPTPTATASPTITSTATASPTPTPFRTRAAKPGVPIFPYRQVIALAPVDGSVIYGMATGIVLNWTTVGILSDKEWYQVSLWLPGGGEPLVSYTKATSWRLSPEMYRGEYQVRGYSWQVRVAYRPGGEGNDVALSPPSERLGFQWR